MSTRFIMPYPKEFRKPLIEFPSWKNKFIFYDKHASGGAEFPGPYSMPDRGLDRNYLKPQTYEAAKDHIKAERFDKAVKILWKLHCKGKAKETEEKAREGGDWFTIATLRYMQAASKDYESDAYLRAFICIDSMNSMQAQAFIEQVVNKKHEFSEWDKGLLEEEIKNMIELLSTKDFAKSWDHPPFYGLSDHKEHSFIEKSPESSFQQLLGQFFLRLDGLQPVRTVDSFECIRNHDLLRMDTLQLLQNKASVPRFFGVSKVEVRIRITPTNAVVLKSIEPKEASYFLENELRRVLSAGKDDYTRALPENRKETLELCFDYTP